MIYSLILIFFMGSSALAENCITYDFSKENEPVEICVGDQVYYTKGITKFASTIKAFFRNDREKPVLLDGKRVAIENIAPTEGCIDGICVGDVIYQPGFIGYWENTVLAINPHREQPLIVEGTIDFAVPTKEVFIDYGCWKNFCVGDMVYTGPSDAHLVVGINPYLPKSIVLADGYAYHPNDLALDYEKLSPFANLESGYRDADVEYSLDFLNELRDVFGKELPEWNYEF